MTNGHDSGGMDSCNRDVHEDAAESKKPPQTPRPAVSRDDNMADAVKARASTPSQ